MQQNNNDFISLYLQYTAKTECPVFFHRWTSLCILSAWLGRSIRLPFGHFHIHANMYCMLVGLAGTKKSTAIKIGSALLKSAGYKTFAARKTRQEKFLIDLSEQNFKSDPTLSEADILERNLFGTEDSSIYESLPPAEVFVPADEINNFIGIGNLDFMRILGELWDYEGVYDYKLKNSTDVHIPNPTITILGGNTFSGLNKLFPVEAMEEGFFSRMLFIHAEPNGVKYTIPETPSQELKSELIETLNNIKKRVMGTVTLSKDAYLLLDKIYKNWRQIDDIRFDAYSNRRQAHLLKLCMISAAIRYSTKIEEVDIIHANTILTFTEYLMPKALGEFGKARNSEVTHKVMMLFDATLVPLSFQFLWKQMHKDLDRREQLAEILGNLMIAEKIQSVGPNGYLPIRKVRENEIEGTVDWSLLTRVEKDGVI